MRFLCWAALRRACYHVRRVDHVSTVGYFTLVTAPGIGIGLSWPSTVLPLSFVISHIDMVPLMVRSAPLLQALLVCIGSRTPLCLYKYDATSSRYWTPALRP